MEDHCDSTMNSERSLSTTRSDSKIITSEKQTGAHLEEKHELARKRLKMKDLESRLASEENEDSKCNHEDGHDIQLSFSEDMSQLTKVALTLDPYTIQAERSGRSTFPVEVNRATKPLDLNVEDCSTKYPPCEEREENTKHLGKATSHGKICRDYPTECVSSRGIGVDLNLEDVSSSLKPNLLSPPKDGANFKCKDMFECGSSASPLKDKDPMKIWKEMKQNGYMSSSQGSIPLPKQRGRKNKNDVQKKRIEIAKKEQVSRFAKLAAPSGLLNELNPGIINHVRNRKQVHSIIEALVTSEKNESQNAGSKQANNLTNDTADVCRRKDLEHVYDTGVSQQNFLHEEHFRLYAGSRHKREHLGLGTDTHVLFPGGKGNNREQCMAGLTSLKGCTSFCTAGNEEDTLTLKLCSSTKASESSSSVSNEDSSSFTGVSSLSVKAATVACRWLKLLHQDTKGRLSALQRSKKRVRAVISTELPFLSVKEFSSNQENNPYVIQNSSGFLNNSNADMHQERWSILFEQMEVTLSEEEKGLESFLEQVQKMLGHLNQGLQHIHGQRNYGVQQLELIENNISDQTMDSSDKELAIGAAAASIYSTCSFISSENLSR